MLTADDASWIKDNRADIVAGRTESITIVHATSSGSDPYTGEPTYSTITESVDVVWNDVPASGGDYDTVSGVELRKGDAKVTFPYGTVLSDVSKVTRNSVDYTLITDDAKGVGVVNRYECVVRRVI